MTLNNTYIENLSNNEKLKIWKKPDNAIDRSWQAFLHLSNFYFYISERNCQSFVASILQCPETTKYFYGYLIGIDRSQKSDKIDPIFVNSDNL